jgi:hypothetical protein
MLAFMIYRRQFLWLLGQLVLIAQPAQAGDVERKLAMEVAVDRGIDKDTPLHDVLEFLGDRYELKIRIDRTAFKDAGVKNVENFPIQLSPQKKVSLGALLQLILKQVPATYRVKGNEVVVVPLDKIS